MSTTYTSTIEVNVWKEHTCVCCGTRYRYLFKRTKKGTGATPDAATTNAHNSVLKSLEHEVDLQPCPGCGSYQPDMIAAQRSSRHWLVLWCSLPLLGLVTLLALFDTLTISTGSWLLGMFAGIALLGNLLIDLINLNANPAANLELAQRLEAQGDLWVPYGLKQKNGPPVGSGINLGHYLGYGLLLLAMLAFFAAGLYMLAIGRQGNAGWYPQVLGPGDEGYLYFDKRITCVDGRWRGMVHVLPLNLRELALEGGIQSLKGRTREDNWGNTISVSSRSKTSTISPYAYIRLPEDARLEGKTLDLQIDLTIVYPQLIGNNQYQERTERLSERHQIVLSSSRAGSTCIMLWWLGLVVGSICFTTGGILLPLASAAFAKQANPTEIYDPTEGTGRSRRRSAEDAEEAEDGAEHEEADDRPRRKRRRDDDY